MLYSRTTLRNASGFTLIEILTVTAILGIVLSGFWQYTTFQHKIQSGNQKILSNVSQIYTALQSVATDVRKAGYGAPDLPQSAAPATGGPVELANTIAMTPINNGVHASAHDALQSIDTSVNESDELVLGSTLFMQNREAAYAYGIVVNEELATSSYAEVSEIGSDFFKTPNQQFIAYNAGRQPVPSSALAFDQIFVVQNSVDPADPAHIGAAYGLNYLTLGGTPGPTFANGFELYGIDPAHFANTNEKTAKIQYAVVPNGRSTVGGLDLGTLRKFYFGDGAELASTFDIPVIDNVITFQIETLVYPCIAGQAQSVWENDPDNSDAALAGFWSPAYPNAGSRMIQRRARIQAIRISVLTLSPHSVDIGAASADIHNYGGATVVQDAAIAGLDDTERYELREITVDPFNYRLRDNTWTVRDQASHNDKFDTVTGNCRTTLSPFN